MLGRGGMAEVFVARRDGPHGFSKRVAIKRILPQLAQDPRLVAMFCDEARIQAALSHPNLVEVFDFGEHQGQPYIALEYVEGMSVAELITRIAARRRTVEFGPALHIVREVLQALDYVHNARDDEGRALGIVHRDVAPSNILVGRQGQVKLGDFGIVRSTAIDSRTVPGELKGKIGYVSPEQALGMPLDGRSDLFSLGIVLAELLICEPLFEGGNELAILQSLHSGNLAKLRSAGSHIPAELKAVVVKALSRWPEQRFASALEFAEALDGVAQRLGEGLGAHVLSEWLVDMGLVALSSEVQQKPSVIPELVRQDASDDAFVDTVALAPGESEAPPASIADALSAVLPDNDVPPELEHAVSRGRGRTEAPTTYRIQRSGGAVMGPFRLAAVLEMLATGRLSIDGAVSRLGAPFVAVPSMVELARMLARPAYRYYEPLALYTKERWAFQLEQAPEVVFGIARNRRTGLLSGRRGSEQVRIWFVDGTVVFSSSTDPRELLGSRLLETDGIPRDALEEVVEHAWRTGRSLGACLIDRGLATPERVDAALREQSWRRLVALLRFRVGELAFVEGARHGEEPSVMPPRLGFVASALLSAYAADEVASVLERVEHSGVLTGTAQGRVLVAALALPEAERVALCQAQRGATLRSLMQDGVRSGTFDARVARRAVWVGLLSGALRCDG